MAHFFLEKAYSFGETIVGYVTIKILIKLRAIDKLRQIFFSFCHYHLLKDIL